MSAYWVVLIHGSDRWLLANFHPKGRLPAWLPEKEVVNSLVNSAKPVRASLLRTQLRIKTQVRKTELRKEVRTEIAVRKTKVRSKIRTETQQRIKPLETMRNPALARAGGRFGLKQVRNKT